jgi:hypothetical protein
MNVKEQSIADFLAIIVVENKNDSIAVRELKHALHERGFGILLATAAIPICIPIPAPPGYTTLFSIPLFIFSIQMILGMQTPWLPAWIEGKNIQRSQLEKILAKANPWLKKIEHYMHPRMTYISTQTWERIIGMLSFILSVSIAMPLPLTNFIPGWGILVMSLGLLSKDGLTILIGMAIGVAGIGLTIIVLIMIWLGMSIPAFY